MGGKPRITTKQSIDTHDSCTILLLHLGADYRAAAFFPDAASAPDSAVLVGPKNFDFDRVTAETNHALLNDLPKSVEDRLCRSSVQYLTANQAQAQRYLPIRDGKMEFGYYFNNVSTEVLESALAKLGCTVVYGDSLMRGMELNEEMVAAIDKGNRAKVRQLLAAGINPEGRDVDGLPFLTVAVYSGVEMIKLLLASGASVDLATRRGTTALHIAASDRLEDVFLALVDAGANTTLEDCEGETALTLSCYSDEHSTANDTLVRKAVDAGASVNHRTHNGWTSLMRLAREGNKALVTLLLEHGAELYPPQDNGMNALQLADLNHNTEVAQVLRNAPMPAAPLEP